MKKFLTILAVAGFMTACNNADDDTSAEDSTRRADSMGSMNTPTPAPGSDTMNMGKDTMNMGKDTINNMKK